MAATTTKTIFPTPVLVGDYIVLALFAWRIGDVALGRVVLSEAKFLRHNPMGNGRFMFVKGSGKKVGPYEQISKTDERKMLGCDSYPSTVYTSGGGQTGSGHYQFSDSQQLALTTQRNDKAGADPPTKHGMFRIMPENPSDEPKQLGDPVVYGKRYRLVSDVAESSSLSDIRELNWATDSFQHYQGRVTDNQGGFIDIAPFWCDGALVFLKSRYSGKATGLHNGFRFSFVDAGANNKWRTRWSVNDPVVREWARNTAGTGPTSQEASKETYMFYGDTMSIYGDDGITQRYINFDTHEDVPIRASRSKSDASVYSPLLVPYCFTETDGSRTDYQCSIDKDIDPSDAPFRCFARRLPFGCTNTAVGGMRVCPQTKRWTMCGSCNDLSVGLKKPLSQSVACVDKVTNRILMCGTVTDDSAAAQWSVCGAGPNNAGCNAEPGEKGKYESGCPADTTKAVCQNNRYYCQSKTNGTSMCNLDDLDNGTSTNDVDCVSTTTQTKRWSCQANKWVCTTVTTTGGGSGSGSSSGSGNGNGNTPPPATSSPPPPPPSSKSSMLWMGVLLVIVIAMVIAIYYYYYSQGRHAVTATIQQQQ